VYFLHGELGKVKTEGSRMLAAAGLDWHPDCE